MNEYFTLNNEVQIPSIGFGTWQMADGEEVAHAVKTAIQCGYRHIDTAAIYKNEKGVGQGIKDAGMDRKKLFVTSKLWNTERGYHTTLAAFEKTVNDLQLDYLDLYLAHWPANAKQFDNWQELNNETWRAFEKLYADGKIRAIGVSNFLKHHLEALLEKATVKPTINQLEFNPGFMQSEAVSFCHEQNIIVEGWSPLGRGKVLSHEGLQEIAKRYNKSVAQICIRWALQNKVLPLPKSVTSSRIKENVDVFDFEISTGDMKIINQLDEIGASGLHPDAVDF